MRSKVKNYILMATIVVPFLFGMFLIDPAHDKPALLCGYWLAYAWWLALFVYANFVHGKKKDEKTERKEEFTCFDLKR